uniref:RNA helicase n=1 Tax=Setaria digitata TaxID=48799 RepID=A0A915PR77_9BILA
MLLLLNDYLKQFKLKHFTLTKKVGCGEVDANERKFIERLREAVSIPSVSGHPQRRADVVRMVQWTKMQLENLGVKTELCDIGKETLLDGSEINLPPVLFGTLGDDKDKKTLLIYGHLDVQPAEKSDGWSTEPFSLIEKANPIFDGKLFGRGSTDDKGPIVAWLNALETLRKCEIPIPVNIKFCFEAMEESGSLGLEEALEKKKDTFLNDVSFTCISDSYWLGKTKPCISYGLRGLCYYFIEIIGCKQDLHSGVYGGSIYEPMSDLIWLMSQLTDVKGNIKIKGIMDLVAPVTDEERKLYEKLDFNVEDYRTDVGAVKLISDSKETILMNRWRNPTLSVHVLRTSNTAITSLFEVIHGFDSILMGLFVALVKGIVGASSVEDAKTVIPAKVIGKFSLRLVPNMKPATVDCLVVDHLNALWKTRGSPNHFEVKPLHSSIYWLSDFKDPHYQCGARAIQKVYGMEPDYIREGGSIPVTVTFQELTKSSVLLLPIGGSDDMAHSQDEKINLLNYIQGIKLLGVYILDPVGNDERFGVSVSQLPVRGARLGWLVATVAHDRTAFSQRHVTVAMQILLSLVVTFKINKDMAPVLRTVDVETDLLDFNSLMLNRTSLNALAKAGFTKPSPVQARAIPSGMLGLDLLVQAKSGTGKTMVFSLLAVENLNAQFGRPQVLIVAPTREIASQIVSYIRMLAPAVIHVGMFVGGNEKGVTEDIQKLKKSIHIVVGTTGRLCHLVRINALRLSYVRFFVLDEADKLMEDNFQREINYLFSALPPEKQVAVFSATYPYRLDATLTHYMRDVHLVRVDTDAQLLGVKQYVIVTRNETRKMNILLRLLLRLRYGQCIIFVNDHKKCEELCVDLQQAKFDALCISGSMPQTDRTKAIRQLKNSMVKLLVSTDLIARGIDAPGVNIVINYGSPLVLATYLHRIGRAGRFGTQGAAFTIISSDKELKLFSDFATEGKLRTKVLRMGQDWPSNLVYNDGFFNSSEDFHPYTGKNSDIQQDHYDDENEGNAYELVHFDSNKLLEVGEKLSKLYENDITLRERSKERIYSSQDLYNICKNMTSTEIPDILLRKLVTLKIRSPYNISLTKRNTLMTLRMGTINKHDEGINAAEKSCLDRLRCPLNSETNFTMPIDISISRYNTYCKKRRYLRNQILAVRKALCNKEWLQYAKICFGSAMRDDPFVICNFHKDSIIHLKAESKSNNIHGAQLESLGTKSNSVSDSEAHEFANFDGSLSKNLAKHQSDSRALTYPFDEKYTMSNLPSSSNLQELNSKSDEANRRKKNDTKYETSKELRTKLAKVKSKFSYELVLEMDKIREYTTSTEEPEICFMSTQTENGKNLLMTSSTQTDGSTSDIDQNSDRLNSYFFPLYIRHEINQFERYMKHLRRYDIFDNVRVVPQPSDCICLDTLHFDVFND